MALSFFRSCGLAQIRSVRLPKFYSTASLVDVKVDDKSGSFEICLLNINTSIKNCNFLQDVQLFPCKNHLSTPLMWI